MEKKENEKTEFESRIRKIKHDNIIKMKTSKMKCSDNCISHDDINYVVICDHVFFVLFDLAHVDMENANIKFMFNFLFVVIDTKTDMIVIVGIPLSLIPPVLQKKFLDGDTNGRKLIKFGRRGNHETPGIEIDFCSSIPKRRRSKLCPGFFDSGIDEYLFERYRLMADFYNYKVIESISIYHSKPFYAFDF